MDLYELRQLAAFAERGTLSAAAEALHLSQPALSRNMKKLEEELGVALFERRKNRLALNENGEYVLRIARELLSSADGLPARVQEFDRRHRAITVGLCAPAPGWLLTPLLSSIYPGRMLQTEILPWNKLLEGLDSGRFQLAVLAREPESGRYFSRECGRESLMFALPPLSQVCPAREPLFCGHGRRDHAADGRYRLLGLRAHGEASAHAIFDAE